MMTAYILRLFIAGHTPRSAHAIENLKQICESHLQNNFRLMVVDVLEQPELTEKHRVLATPTVIKEAPRPVRRIVGDLTETEKVMLGLDLTTNEQKDVADDENKTKQTR